MASRAVRVTWVAWAVLLLTQAGDAWARQAPWIVWLAVLLPLLIFLPGMLRDNLRSYLWLCFVALLYFMRLVVALFARPEDFLAITGMLAVVVMFLGAMFYVRWRARELRTLDNEP
jgi:uncharacterized membrane protein